MYQRILVPVDGSPTSNAGLAEAIKLAKLTDARVRVLHVVDEMPFIIRRALGFDDRRLVFHRALPICLGRSDVCWPDRAVRQPRHLP